MIKVLFICHGNICRSPMAEFMFKKMLKDRSLEDRFEVQSAATSSEEIWNGIGNPVYPPARDELASHGISCQGKRARQLTPSDYLHYDFLICMDNSNIRNAERILGNDKEHKLSLLLDYCGRRGASISDPWYSGDFKTTYCDIDEGLNGFLSYLCENGLL